MKKQKKLYVIWYLPQDAGQKGWPTLNGKNTFKTLSKAVKALEQFMKDWPDEDLALRIMTPEQLKKER